jgi:hypothetical protein
MFSGLTLAAIGYLTIIFGKGTKQSKIKWTLALLLSIVLEVLTEPILIKSSFLIYIHNNQDNLKEINNMLISHRGTIYIYPDTIVSDDIVLTDEEFNRLLILRKNVDAQIIIRNTKDIYYGLWGLLDVRLGIWYSIHGDEEAAATNRRNIKDNWFY